MKVVASIGEALNLPMKSWKEYQIAGLICFDPSSKPIHRQFACDLDQHRALEKLPMSPGRASWNIGKECHHKNLNR